jgi:hypothetical protein
MISGLPAATISVTTVPPAVNNGVADPDITVSFQSFRATDDATSLGTDKPEPSPTGTANTASIDLDHVGSFQILAYVDSNGSGVWDSGETGLTLPLILVTAAGVIDRSQANPGNLIGSVQSIAPALALISTGAFDLSNQGQNAGMYLAATFTLIGGGTDGTRGTDRVFAGFSQQIVTENWGGTYSSGGGTVTVAAVSNAAQGTPDPATGVRSFPAGGAIAPTVLALPVLDSGVRPVGTIGGYHETASTNRITSVGPPSGLAGSLGIQMLVEAEDSPDFSIPYFAPGGTTNLPLTEFHMNFGVCDSLVLWSNVTGNNALTPITLGALSAVGWGATGQWADTIFGVLLQRPWIVSATYSGASPSGVPATPIGTPTISSPPVMLPSPLPNGQCSSVIYTPPPTWVTALPSTALTPILALPDAAALLALIFGTGH